MTQIDIQVAGLEETQERLAQMAEDLSGPRMAQGMRTATLLVTRDAKILSPVDTGRLRASILPKVTVRPKGVQGVVGSPVEYAPVQEKRVGYLREALSRNIAKIRQILGNVVTRIVSR